MLSCLFSQYMNGGTLEDILQEDSVILPWSVRIKMATDVAKGIAYLHHKGVFHRDLTSKVSELVYNIIIYNPHLITAVSNYCYNAVTVIIRNVVKYIHDYMVTHVYNHCSNTHRRNSLLFLISYVSFIFLLL